MEQRANNRIIRPSADYTGPESAEWVAIEDRGINHKGQQRKELSFVFFAVCVVYNNKLIARWTFDV